MLGRGAGAEMRRLLGVAVFSGMLGVTVFGIFLTPVFFYVLQWFGRDIPADTKQAPPTPPDPDLAGPPRHQEGIQIRSDHPPHG